MLSTLCMLLGGIGCTLGGGDKAECQTDVKWVGVGGDDVIMMHFTFYRCGGAVCLRALEQYVCVCGGH